MADYNLGTAHGVVEITADTKGLAAANAQVDAFGKNAEKRALTTKQAVDKMGTGMLIAGGAIAGGLAIATKTAIDFEKQVSAIGAVSGATADEMQKIRDKALQIGKDTAFSASDAAVAIQELAKAGVSTTDILNGAADATVALAAAGEVDLPFAATVASNAMNSFNLAAKDLVGVTDVIAGAANASAIDVSDFGMSLSQVGAVANLAGLNFEDTAIAIAEMGNAGIKGSDAGTSLKSMLMRLQPQTKKQVAAMTELGILTEDGNNKFYDQEGRLKSLADIQSILSTSLKGMTKEQKQATLQTLFGSDAIRAAAVLADEGAKGYDKMSKAIGKTSAADVAAKRLDNLAGSWEQLKGSAETLGIQLGSVLLPALRKIVDGLTGLLNTFLALPDGVKTTIVTVAAAAAAFLLVGGAIIKIVSFAKGLVAAIQAIRTAMLAMNLAFAANPIGLIIIAVIALVAALIWLWNNCETFRDIVTAVWEKVKEVALAVFNWFKDTLLPGLKVVWDLIVESLENARDSFKAVWDAIYAIVEFVFNAIKLYITTYINIWKTIITTGLNVIKTVFTTVWNAVKAIVQFVLNVIKAYISVWVTVVTGIVRGIIAVYNFIRDAFQRAYDAIKEKLTAAVNFVRGIPGKILGALGNLGRLLWDAGSRIMTGFLDGLKAGFKPIQDFVGGIAGWIADNKGPKAVDMKLLVKNGEWIMDGLDRGMNKGYKDVKKNVSKMGDGISKTMRASTKQVSDVPLAAGVTATSGAAGTAQVAAGFNMALLAREETLQKLVEATMNVRPTEDVSKVKGKGKGKGGDEALFAGGGVLPGKRPSGSNRGSSASSDGSNNSEGWTTPIVVSRGRQADAARLAAAAAAYATRGTTAAGSRLTAQADALAGDFGRGTFGGGDFNVVVNNPVPEPASESVTRALRKATFMGLGDL